jgi:hypothetical protein
MTEWAYIVYGLIFTLVMLRLLKTALVELFFFGSLFALVETVHYWGAEFIGMPDFPLWVHKFTAGAMLSWIVFRLLYVAASQWVKPLRPMVRLIFGSKSARL